MYQIVEEVHQPLCATAARGVGPVALGNGASGGDRSMVGALAFMGLAGLGILWWTRKQRGQGLFGLNPSCSCGG